MFVVKEIVSVELLRKLDQLIYRVANDRNGGLGLFCGVMAWWCLGPKCQDQTVHERKRLCVLLEEPGRHTMRKEVVWSSAAHLKQRTH